VTGEHEGVWESPRTPEPVEEPAVPAEKDPDALAAAAAADETLAPGTMPGGPEYPQELAEPEDEAG